jgi:hypothetical protein
LEHTDNPVVRRIVREAAQTGEAGPRQYRWSSIILGIVKSMPFQMRKSAAAGTAVAESRP